VCQPVQPAGFGGPQVLAALMLVVPLDLAEARGGAGVAGAERAAPLPVGTSCRICPRADCAARREPSIMADVL
jgi:predicted transcriptional regulator